MRSQTHVEYLVMVGIGVLLALVAAAGMVYVAKTMGDEVGKAYKLKDAIIGGLR